VTAELPGVDEKDLDVTLANGMLTIRGEKRTERDEQDKDKNWYVVTAGRPARSTRKDRSPRTVTAPSNHRSAPMNRRPPGPKTAANPRRWRTGIARQSRNVPTRGQQPEKAARKRRVAAPGA